MILLLSDTVYSPIYCQYILSNMSISRSPINHSTNYDIREGLVNIGLRDLIGSIFSSCATPPYQTFGEVPPTPHRAHTLSHVYVMCYSLISC